MLNKRKAWFYLFSVMFFMNTGFSQEDKSQNKKNVAIFIYEGVEILDFGGPAEVFASTSIKKEDGKWHSVFNVYTVALTNDQITSQGFIKVTPNYSIGEAPDPDIIILPGGSTGNSRKSPEVINWIKDNAKQNDVMLSVCTGAFLLGDAGLLKGKKATTWYGALDRFKSLYPETDVLKNVRFVDNGNIITTAGVSAGIDGSLHLVKKLFGVHVAKETAQYMEYDKWDDNAGFIVASNSNDHSDIKRAALNYLEGFYEGDVEKIKKSIHPDLSKYGYSKDDESKAYKGHPMSYERALEFAREVSENAEWAAPEDAIKKVEILDVQDKIACVKLTAYWGIDYLLLAKHNGNWMIMKVIWQGLD